MRPYFKDLTIAFISLLVGISSSFENIELGSLFKDDMVLQLNTTVPIWGTADACEKVTVKLAKQNCINNRKSSIKFAVTVLHHQLV